MRLGGDMDVGSENQSFMGGMSSRSSLDLRLVRVKTLDFGWIFGWGRVHLRTYFLRYSN